MGPPALERERGQSADHPLPSHFSSRGSEQRQHEGTRVGAGAGTLSLNAGATATLDLAALCSDVNGDLDPTTFAVATAPTAGTVSIDAAGIATYTNTDSTATSDTFTFTVADTGGLTSDPATATVTINPPATTTTSTTTSTTSTTTTTTTVVTTVGSGTSNFTTTCSNNATTDPSTIKWTARGTSLASFKAGDTVPLRNQRWNVTVNASTFDTGINLKLIKAGDTLTANVETTIKATNTVEGTRTDKGMSFTVVVAVDDTGAAKDATASFFIPDSNWTATGAGPIVWSVVSTKLSVIIPVIPTPIIFKCTADPGSAPILDTSAPQVLGDALAFTGIRSGGVVLPIAISLILLDLGYMAWSSTRADRRRFF